MMLVSSHNLGVGSIALIFFIEGKKAIAKAGRLFYLNFWPALYMYVAEPTLEGKPVPCNSALPLSHYADETHGFLANRSLRSCGDSE